MTRNMIVLPSKHIWYECLQSIVFSECQDGQMTTPWGLQEEIPSRVSK
jgi:hypothetical protein